MGCSQQFYLLTFPLLLGSPTYQLKIIIESTEDFSFHLSVEGFIVSQRHKDRNYTLKKMIVYPHK